MISTDSAWQQTRNSQTQRKLYQIYPTVPSYSTLPSLYQRKDQSKAYITDYILDILVYLIEHTDPPKCFATMLAKLRNSASVSYTHLTLPTILRV